MALTAIDPGADCGVATFDVEGRLYSAALDRDFRGVGGDVCIELPQVYRTGKARPQDLIALAVRVGETKYKCELKGAKVKLVWPHDWKGSLSKDMMALRIMAKLDPLELEIVNRVQCPKSKLHNVIDAVGIGLWALGRLGK